MSARRRGATGLSGVLLIDKPLGLTSHDVVARIRRVTGEGRVGHAGTLDPMATGLLVVLVGPATRLEPYLSSARKSYEAEIAFGSRTDTDDAEGRVAESLPVPGHVLTEESAREILAGFLGDSEQTPPAYSAIKVGGKVAHREARAGEALELAKRPVTVYAADLVSISGPDKRWTVRFEVSKGTYIRALARDIGEAAGTAAHLSGLRRTSSGALSVTDALGLEAVMEAGASGIAALFTDPIAALELPARVVDPAATADGRAIDALPEDPDRVALTDSDGSLLAIYRRDGERLVADTVFPQPIGGSR